MNEKVNARIQALEAELAWLKKDLAEPKKEGRFIAKKNEMYKTIMSNNGEFVSIQQRENRDKLDNMRQDSFNYFRPDTDEADRMAEKINLLLAMTARVKELNGDWEADYSGDLKKWGIRSYNYGKWNVDWCISYNFFVFNLSVQSKEHAGILLNEFKERIEKYY